MTKDQVKAVLQRVPTWPNNRQQELAEIALEIEAELAGAEYDATPDELTAIDEGLAVEAASDEEVKAAFALFRKGMRVENSKRALADLPQIVVLT
jgi:hypothetical protein